ncbi:hypothetical protein ACFE04_016844 [Oxalis oulophora]
MDLEDFRSILERTGVDVWSFIDTAIDVASIDHTVELKQRRDKIVEKLYASSSSSVCRNCDFDKTVTYNNTNTDLDVHHQLKEEEFQNDDDFTHHHSKQMQSAAAAGAGADGDGDGDGVAGDNEDDDELDTYAELFEDDEQNTLLEIKEQLQIPNQSEDTLVNLLQSLAEMDITFKALKEADIGRHVTQFKKHLSKEVSRIARQLVRKWKDIVDEHMKLNNPGEVGSAAMMADEYSPPQKIRQNGHPQVPDFGYSPNPHNGSSGSDKNDYAPERKPKPVVPRKEVPSKPSSLPASRPAPYNRQKEQQRESTSEAKLDSVTKRLRESYKEHENAKKQRTIQVMDIRELPKQKNTFFAKNRGGGSQGRHKSGRKKNLSVLVGLLVEKYFVVGLLGFGQENIEPYVLDVKVEKEEDVITHIRLLQLAHDHPATRPVFQLRPVQVYPIPIPIPIPIHNNNNNNNNNNNEISTHSYFALKQDEDNWRL